MHIIRHTQEHLHVASNFCYVYSDAQLRSDIQLPHSWTTLSRDFQASLLQQLGPHIYGWLHRLIGLVGTVFANGPVDLGSIPGRVIPKTLKMVLDTSLLNTQQYKVCIKGKVEKSRERSSALPDTSVYSLLKRETSGRPRLRSPTYNLHHFCP